jgi:AraC-like DNA-binding protein
MLAKLESFINIVHQPMDYVLPQQHNVYELVYYHSGDGTTVINGETFSYKKHTLALIEPNQVHDEMAKSLTEVYCCLFSLPDEILFKIGVVNLDDKLSEIIFKLISEISEEFMQKSFNYELQMSCYLQLIINELLRKYAVTEGENINKALDYAKIYIKENFAAIVNFDAIAFSIGYSQDRFRHLFTDRFGTSPGKYLTGLKIAKAKELLEYSEQSIKIIAKKCGFNSDIVFMNRFKTITGLTPTSYRLMTKNPVDYLNIDNYRDDILEHEINK